MNKYFEKIAEIAGFVSKEKSASPNVYASSTTNPFMMWGRPKKIDPQKALDVYTGWVYAAIRAISVEIGGMKHRLFKIGEDRDDEIFQHDVLDLLGGVNEYQTGLELKYTTAAHLEATGNAYWFMEGVANDTDKPTALHLMNPAHVKVIVNREEFPARIQAYQYRLGSKTYIFQPYQVIHFKYPDPSDPFEGIGTVQTAAQWIDADNYAMEFNRRFFLNGARIGGFLESESAFTPEQLKYMKTSFEAAFKGVDNAYKILALPKGTKYEEGGKTQKDMDFSNLSLAMRDRIIAAFRVPRTALGITDDVNRANAEATDYVFAARTIRPIMQFITTYLNEFLVYRYGSDIYLDFEDPVPEDRAQKMDEMSKALGAGGGSPAISINEARERYFGLEDVDGGDELRLPYSLTPLSSSGDQNTGTPTSASMRARVEGKRNIRTRFAINAKVRHGLAETFAKKTTEEVAGILKEIAQIKTKAMEDRKNISQLSDDEYEKVWKGFALRVDGFEKKQKVAVQDFNNHQRMEVLKNLPKVTKAFLDSKDKAINKADLFDKEEAITALVDLSSPILTDLAGKEGKEAALLLGIDNLDILSPEVRRALDKSIELLSRNYNDTTRDLLKDKLEEGLKNGLSQDELAEKVNEIYDYSDDVRAVAVARTETFRVANMATQEAWKQSGIVKAQKWYTASDERVCPYCAPLNGKVVSIDSDFFKKGDSVQGSDGSTFVVDYANVGSPPLHVSCRCYIRPEDISIS